ncbi:MAG TPA: hypothetical protein GX699_10940, partial [Firmicutes bacterium]|nr:hypothetical protein [Bacillota bacterium]
GYGPTNPMAELWYDAESVRIPRALSAAADMLRQSNVPVELPANARFILLYCREEAETPADVAALNLPAAAAQEVPLPETAWGKPAELAETLLSIRRRHPQLQALLAFPEMPGLNEAAARGTTVVAGDVPPEDASTLLLYHQDRQFLLPAATPQDTVDKLLQLLKPAGSDNL